MSGIKQEIVPFGGINLDDDPLLLPQGDYLELRNVHNGVSEGGFSGNLESMKGTTWVSSEISNVDGVSTVIGGCPDVGNNRYVYFIHNSLNKHCIYAVHGPTRSVVEIVSENEYLGFSLDRKIHSAAVLNGTLFWVDGTRPKSLNIDRAMKYTAGGADGYNEINARTLDMIRWSPSGPPTAEYTSDPYQKENFLHGRLYKFSYRYVYFDYSKSVWSTWSKVPLVGDLYETDGTFLRIQKTNNCLQVSVNTGSHDVIKVEIAFSHDNGITFFLGKTIEKYDGTTQIVESDTEYIYSFYNNEQYTVLDMTDFIRPYDNIPLAADSLEVLKDNRIAIARCNEGYDNTDVDLSVERVSSYTDDEMMEFQFVVPSPVFIMGDWYLKFDFSQISTDLLPGIFNFDFNTGLFNNNNEEFKFEIIFMALLGSTYAGMALAFKDAIDAWNSTNQDAFMPNSMWTWPTLQYIIMSGSTHILYLKQIPGVPAGFHLEVNTADFTQIKFLVQKSWKMGSYVEVGVVYYDEAGRHGFVNICEGSKVKIPFFTDPSSYPVQYPQLQGNNFYDKLPINVLKTSISSAPPDWASKYQLVVSYPRLDFVQFVCDIAALSGGPYPYVTASINSSIDTRNEGYKNTILVGWEFEKGDRIRFLGSYVDESISGFYKYSDYYDFEVQSADIENGLITFKSSYFADRAPITNVMVEVYRPMKDFSEEKTFHEIGEAYDIGEWNGQKYHMGNTQDQFIVPRNHPASPLIASYPASNQNDLIYMHKGFIEFCGQSFIASATGYLNDCRFYLGRFPSAQVDRNIYAEIYECGGVFGSTSIPVGDPIATSDPIHTSTLNTDGSFSIVTFKFFGINRIQLTIGNAYCLVIRDNETLTGALLILGLDTDQPSHPGNYFYKSGGVWIPDANTDVIFYVNVFTEDIPAIVSMDSGNVYIRRRQMKQTSGQIVAYVEDTNLSDFYMSESNDMGRVNVVNAFARNETLEIIRHGGRYIENTKVNNLHSFDANAYVALKASDGKITKVVERGGVLKVLQEKKLTNIDIQARELRTLSGGGIATTDSVFGSLRPSLLDYGCQDPCSVVLHHSYLYFYDRINGCIVRDGGDGPTEISKYKISSHIKNLSRRINESGLPAFVMGAFDNRFDYYILQFVCMDNSEESSIDYSDNLFFQEYQNRWKGSIDLYKTANGINQYVEWMGNMGDYTYAFIDGSPWILFHHDEHLNMFAEQKYFKLKVSANVNPGDVKAFDSMAIHTNILDYDALKDEMYFRVDPIEIPGTIDSQAMRSRLKPVKFTKYEKRIEAEFLRDINTPMNGTEIEKLLNGRPLKGTHMLLTLTHRNPDRVLLSRVTVNMSPSDITR